MATASIIATLSDRPVRVTGTPYSGWHAVALNDTSPGTQVLTFNFCIQDDGGWGFILAFGSKDQGATYFNDTWHESLEEAFVSAREQFGIERSEWQEPEPSEAP